jgi:hypothetical protein
MEKIPKEHEEEEMERDMGDTHRVGLSTRQHNTKNRLGTSDIPTHCVKKSTHRRANILGGD